MSKERSAAKQARISDAEFYKQAKEEARRKQLPSKYLKEGREIASSYTVVLEPYPNEGFRGRTLELPYVVGFGATPAECTSRLQEALAVALGSLLANKIAPPAPAIEGKRDEQVNIKLTRHEKAFFTQAARREGFRSIADFMRSLALRRLT